MLKIVTAVVLILSICPTARSQDVRPEILPRLVISRSEPPRAQQRDTGLRQRVPTVTLNEDLVRRLATLAERGGVDGAVSQGLRFMINVLPASTDDVAVVTEAVKRDQQTSVIRGTVGTAGTFTATVHRGFVAMDVVLADRTVRLFPFGSVYQVEEDEPDPDFRERLLPGLPPGAKPGLELGAEEGQLAEDGSRVDILVLYTTATKEAWGGAAQVETGARQIETFLNDALTNSLPGLQPALLARFVRIEEVPNSVGSSLEDMAASTTVKNRRAAAKADLVILVRPGSGYAGQAWVYCGYPTWHRDHAFGVVRSDYLVKWKTVAHEIGHLFGANHDPDNADSGDCWFGDSRGHNFRTTGPDGVERLYGTIMSYPGAANRVPHFSNPSVSFRGVPTGIAGSRNNARAIRASRIQIANYIVGDDQPTQPGTGPRVTFVRPRANAELPANSRIAIVAQIESAAGVSTAELFWQKTNRYLPCPGTNNSDWSCTKQGNEYTWLLDVGEGSRSYHIRATDTQGNRTVTPTRTLLLRQPRVHQVVFVSDRDGHSEIYTMKTDGSDLRRLTQGTSRNYAPTWTPDGHFIVFISERDGNPEMYIMTAEGADQRRLTNTTGSEAHPAVRPNVQ